MPESTSTDDALLARLNALKKSSMSLNSFQSTVIAQPSSIARPDDLAARFARLGSASPSASPKPVGGAPARALQPGSKDSDDGVNSVPLLAPGASSYLEGIAEGVGDKETFELNDEDEKSLEELLGELQEGNTWELGRKEERDVIALVRDARSLFSELQRTAEEQQSGTEAEGFSDQSDERKPTKEVRKEQELTDWHDLESEVKDGGIKAREADYEDGKLPEANEEDETGADEHNEQTEEEAGDVIARIMAELAIDQKNGNVDEAKDNDDEADEDHEPIPNNKTNSSELNQSETPLNLPSAPSSFPADSLDRTQAIEDALTARLAALSAPSIPVSDSLGLPSAPSFSPTKKPSKVIMSNLSKFTNEEIESWCIICTDDATLKCLGCDGDLYCQNCWVEGHRGESAGYEERRHKAVLYGKDGQEGRKGVTAPAG